MKVNLRPKKIIVVGATSGIGYAIVQKLIDDLTVEKIVLVARDEKKLKFTKEKINDSRVSIYQFDISMINKHNMMISEINDMLQDKVDGLVISSGVNFDGSNWKGFNISEDDWDYVMNINLKGTFFLIRTFSNYLHSYSMKGNICVVSSISAHRDMLSVYQISKNAISGIVHAYGKHLCERGVVLNCVEPGTTEGGMLGDMKKYTNGIREGEPWFDNSIKRIIRPEEIAEIVYFLMSNLGEVMSGCCLLAGGGCKSISR